MTRRLLAATALIVTFGAFLFTEAPPAARKGHTMGLIEHRGQFYRFEDLMNPAYRAASNDSFVRSFAPIDQFAADPWAGLEVVDKSKRDPILRHSLEIAEEKMNSVLTDIQKEMLKNRRIPWAGGHLESRD